MASVKVPVLGCFRGSSSLGLLQGLGFIGVIGFRV